MTYHFTNTDNPIDFPKMQKKLYLIEYENSQWCGGELNVVVWATDRYDAEMQASDHMEETQRELFFDEFAELEDEEGFFEECAYTVISVEHFTEDHTSWPFYKDPTQAQFYPVIGEP